MQTQCVPALPRWPAQQKWEALPGCQPRHFTPLPDVAMSTPDFQEGPQQSDCQCLHNAHNFCSFLDTAKHPVFAITRKVGVLTQLSTSVESEVQRVDDSLEASQEGPKSSLKAVTRRRPCPAQHTSTCSALFQTLVPPACPFQAPFLAHASPSAWKTSPPSPFSNCRIPPSRLSFSVHTSTKVLLTSSQARSPLRFHGPFLHLKKIVSPQSAMCRGYHARASLWSVESSRVPGVRRVLRKMLIQLNSHNGPSQTVLVHVCCTFCVPSPVLKALLISGGPPSGLPGKFHYCPQLRDGKTEIKEVKRRDWCCTASKE